MENGFSKGGGEGTDLGVADAAWGLFVTVGSVRWEM